MKRIAAALFIAALCCPAMLRAQTSNLRGYQRHVIEATNFIAGRIRPFLSSSERQIHRGLTVRVPSDWSFTAEASGNRITLSAGVDWTFQQLAAAQIADQYYGYDGCSREYREYFAVNINENSIRKKNGQSIRPVLSPGRFGRSYGGACDGFSDDAIFRPDTIDAYAALMNASLMFVYLHEVAHHVLGHLDSGADRRSVIRQQEAGADEWATRMMVRCDIAAPYAAMPLMQFIALMGGETLEDEIRSTHPLGIRRVRDILQLAEELHEYRGDVGLAEETNDALDAADDLIPSP